MAGELAEYQAAVLELVLLATCHLQRHPQVCVHDDRRTGGVPGRRFRTGSVGHVSSPASSTGMYAWWPENWRSTRPQSGNWFCWPRVISSVIHRYVCMMAGELAEYQAAVLELVLLATCHLQRHPQVCMHDGRRTGGVPGRSQGTGAARHVSSPAASTGKAWSIEVEHYL